MTLSQPCVTVFYSQQTFIFDFNVVSQVKEGSWRPVDQFVCRRSKRSLSYLHQRNSIAHNEVSKGLKLHEAWLTVVSCFCVGVPITVSDLHQRYRCFRQPTNSAISTLTVHSTKSQSTRSTWIPMLPVPWEASLETEVRFVLRCHMHRIKKLAAVTLWIFNHYDLQCGAWKLGR